MKRIHILVEGQTEEAFINTVLGPYLVGVGIFMTPILVKTKLEVAGKNFKGGVVPYGKIEKQLHRLLGDTSAVAVTTMIDYYGLPKDFPGYTMLKKQSSCFERVDYLESKFEEQINHSHFIPFLTIHEFEALLFVSPEHIAETFPEQNTIQQLRQIKSDYSSPEEINGGDKTHPSARLEQLIPYYRKRVHGVIIVERIGLEKIRQECRHFAQWIARLETLG